MAKKSAKPLPKLVAYYRVSTRRQGESGLGLEGQRKAVQVYVRETRSQLIAEFTEVESGKLADRPELAKALIHANLAHATLCIAKLDRLARNVNFLSGLMEGRTPFVACDNPHATPLTIHILAAVAEDEAERISARTRAALGAYKDGKRVSRRIREKYPKGVPAEIVRETAGKLGASLVQCRNLSAEARAKGRQLGTRAAAAAAALRAVDLLPWVRRLRFEDRKSQQAIAAELNEAGLVTRRGKPWSQVAVLRLLRRAIGPAPEPTSS